MFNAFLLKYAEIGVKGKNRYLFEDALLKQIRRALKNVEGSFLVDKEMGRVYVTADGAFDYGETVEALGKVFGITGICPVRIVENVDPENLKKEVVEYVRLVYGNTNQSFKICARRSDKTYPYDSMELNAMLGEAVLDHFPDMTVDLHHPDISLTCEVRNRIYLYSELIPGPGGMPTGTGGRAMVLLSGGIDSPVAAYLVAKRGVMIDAVYFHAPPYTSDRAKQKVADLAKIIASYCGAVRLHIVNFTDIQLSIYDRCPHDELTIIMRRYMMRIAETFARQDQDLGLVTGESIGQVASQTMQSLMCTDEVCELPVYRPVIGFDKQEIIDTALKIGTYETSILPYEDCCTIFVAKHPVTKPDRLSIRKSERKLEGLIEELIERAVREAETVVVYG